MIENLPSIQNTMARQQPTPDPDTPATVETSAPRRRKPRAPAPVAVGSVRPKANARALQKLEVDAAREAAQVVQAEVVGGLMQSGLSADPLRALLDGASPDDLKALRREINARRKPAATGIDPDLELAAGWREGHYPYKNLLSRRSYEEQKYRLQVELLKLQAWVKETRQRVVILFEGRDAAGKGGVIKRITQRLNPRVARVAALPAPSDRERTQWYFQRYVQHLPAAGELVLFDRSWYNRAGVEKVMGFASDAQVAAFLRATPQFERQLVDDGILLFKYWLCCDQAEQEKRFAERVDNPLKGWKLSPIDLEARSRYRAYTEARETMLQATHTRHAPWTLVDFNDQRRGRLTLLRDLLDRLPDTRLEAPALALPPLRGKPAKEHYGVLKPIPAFTG